MGNAVTKAPQNASYSLCHTLPGHRKPINALRFSPDGQLLASAACDACLWIWSTQQGTAFQSISCPANGSITDVLWATNKQNELALLFSCADGSVHVYIRPSNNASGQFKKIRVFQAHAAHVESMDFDQIHQRLATVGKGEAKVWTIGVDWFTKIYAHQQSQGFIARSVHFFNEGQSLLITYLESHRIFAWNVDPWSLLWERHAFSRIGSSALSPNGEHTLIHNFRDGADAYNVPGMNRIATFKVPVRIRTPKQVVLGVAGALVIQGSDEGRVHISEFGSAELVQVLVHSTSRRALVQAVTSHSYREQHWIASGCSTDFPTVKIWKRRVTSHMSIIPSKGFLASLIALIIVWIMTYKVPATWKDDTFSRFLENSVDAIADAVRHRLRENPNSGNTRSYPASVTAAHVSKSAGDQPVKEIQLTTQTTLRRVRRDL